MQDVIEKALDGWRLAGADYQLVAQRENRVYKIESGQRQFALRLHRRHYRSDAELHSELVWMDVVAKGGLDVPAPIANTQGGFLLNIDGVQVDVLIWLDGAPVSSLFDGWSLQQRIDWMSKIGETMAQLHQVSDAWAPGPEFDRCAWDRDGLLGEAPLWGRFWENDTLSSDDCSLFTRARDTLIDLLGRQDPDPDYGLIHADLIRDNMLVAGDRLQLIDFDDGGYGFRLFEIATTLVNVCLDEHYSQLKQALLNGYQQKRSIDTSLLDAFILVRALTYVGWIMSRMDEPGSCQRNIRFIERARKFAKSFLACAG